MAFQRAEEAALDGGAEVVLAEGSSLTAPYSAYSPDLTMNADGLYWTDGGQNGNIFRMAK